VFGVALGGWWVALWCWWAAVGAVRLLLAFAVAPDGERSYGGLSLVGRRLPHGEVDWAEPPSANPDPVPCLGQYWGRGVSAGLGSGP
jgi:hypothetical protein